MENSSNIIWQPRNFSEAHYDFETILCSVFAKKLLSVVLDSKEKTTINRLGGKISKGFGYNNTDPYLFFKDTALVKQITLDGGRGTWLELNTNFGNIPDLSEVPHLNYTTHNMDCSTDTIALLQLFERWIYYTTIMVEPPM